MHTAERFFVIGRSLLLFMHTCPVTEFAAFLHRFPFFPNFSLLFFPPNAIMCSIFNLFIKKMNANHLQKSSFLQMN